MKSWLSMALSMLHVTGMMVACGSPSAQPATQTGQPTAVETIHPTEISTPLPAATPRLVVDLPPLPDPDIPDVLLWYVTRDIGLWKVTADSDYSQIAALSDYVMGHDVSPDGQQLLYDRHRKGNTDIWLMDLATGETRNLTNSPDRDESYPRWWPGHPDQFLAKTETYHENPPYRTTYLTAIDFDGDYQVLGSSRHVGGYEPSPDGQKIAYLEHTIDDAGYFRPPSRPWIYQEGQPVAVPGVISQFIGDKQVHVQDITWSPDGTRMGLAMVEPIRYGEADTLVVVVDMDQERVDVLRRYPTLDNDAGAAGNAPRWSPDGDWFAFTSTVGYSEVLVEGGVWLGDTAGLRPILMSRSSLYPDNPIVFSPPHVSPDGRWVALIAVGEIVFMRVGEWTPLRWAMPRDWSWVGWDG